MSIRNTVARNSDYKETLDYFPTPAYATRALFKYVMPDEDFSEDHIWDPACGGGHMCRVFEEYEPKGVLSSDIKDYGVWTGPSRLERSFQEAVAKGSRAERIITNPPYGDMADFVALALLAASKSVSFLTRIQFLEGQRRYKKIFDVNPPTTVAVFSDRIPFKMGKTTKDVSKMFTHCWVHWDLEKMGDGSKLIWLPPTILEDLEKKDDWDE